MMFSQLLNPHSIFNRLAKALIRLRVCVGWSEALLVAHTTLLEISCSGSLLYVFPQRLEMWEPSSRQLQFDQSHWLWLRPPVRGWWPQQNILRKCSLRSPWNSARTTLSPSATRCLGDGDYTLYHGKLLQSWPRDYKTFSNSTQLSTKLILLIKQLLTF